MSTNILSEIVSFKKKEVQDRQNVFPLREIKERLGSALPVTGFAAALRRPGEVAVIAEVKRRSPSRGVIRENFDLHDIICAYDEAGADAISILTDSEFFGGSPEFLAAAKKMTRRPVLRKDFIVSDYQLYESRVLGADAVLLIAGILEGDMLGEFVDLARMLGMEALVETHSQEEIERALDAGAGIIGINNRDLRTFQVDLNTTKELIKHIKSPEITVVSESGIKTASDVKMLGACGVHAVLVGETLMAARDLQAGVRELKKASNATGGGGKCSGEKG